MSLWKRTMDYLGLGPDDAYDDYDAYGGYDDVENETSSRRARPQREVDARPTNAPSAARRGWEPEAEPAVRSVPAKPSFPSRDFDASPSRRAATGRGDDSGVQIRPSQPSVPRGASSGSSEPHTVRPRRFDQAQEVADKFKDGQPVIMNLEGTERETARRLIDFASGICYALDGSMEKVATGVYLLKPPAQRPARFDNYDD